MKKGIVSTATKGRKQVSMEKEIPPISFYVKHRKMQDGFRWRRHVGGQIQKIQMGGKHETVSGMPALPEKPGHSGRDRVQSHRHPRRVWVWVERLERPAAPGANMAPGSQSHKVLAEPENESMLAPAGASDRH